MAEGQNWAMVKVFFLLGAILVSGGSTATKYAGSPRRGSCGGLESLLGGRRELFIRQKVELAEVFGDSTGLPKIESPNRYRITDGAKRTLGAAAEVGDSYWDRIKRQLGTHRPITLVVWDEEGREILHLTRPWHMFFSSMEVSSPEEGGRSLGSIREKFGLLKRKYDICDSVGAPVACVEGPRFRPWTFNFFNAQGQKIGLVSKKYDGMAQEAFTDADTFYVELPDETWNAEQKSLFLALAFSIDLDHFED